MHFQVTLETDPGGPATTSGHDRARTYTQNRGTLHLHGGTTPWISDGTPHQWITPAGEDTQLSRRASASRTSPTCPIRAPGRMTFFYTNQQSARLMFYHDHAYGITRLNVYAGEAAGYLLTDAVEQDSDHRGASSPTSGSRWSSRTRPSSTRPPCSTTDPTWPLRGPEPGSADRRGDLWYPHVYMPNQNPNDLAGANPMGRWDYGPFFWPPWPTTNPPIQVPMARWDSGPTASRI